ncbi:cytochrome c1 [Arenibaculum sp.]|uniref:cytochrome c1 n=1 Tax=Arenibaculum sp. TaxID=2865862 RepID=UPI002E12F710|nr:cytochrome c1 [Arenibaculum sp.]
MRALKTAVLAAAVGLGLGFGSAASAAEGVVPPDLQWEHEGLFGTFDRGALQRGLQVYTEVCAACHGMSLVAFRNLADLGFNEDEVRAFAARYEVMDGPNDAGEMFARAALPADRFVSPFPNEQAARAANGGALPPDLSLMAKARPYGENYIYAMLTGYIDPPADLEVPPGQYYNAYFPGHLIGMPPVLQPDGVAYADGTTASPERMARDVATFLAWTAEPMLEERKQTGLKVILFLIVFAGLMYGVKRRVWASAH